MKTMINGNNEKKESGQRRRRNMWKEQLMKNMKKKEMKKTMEWMMVINESIKAKMMDEMKWKVMTIEVIIQYWRTDQ